MLFEGFSVSDFHTIFQSKEALYELVDFIVGFVKVILKMFTSVPPIQCPPKIVRRLTKYKQ